METASSSQDSSSSDVNTSSSSYSQGNELSDRAEKLKSEVYDALPTSSRIIKDKNSAENPPSSDNSGSSTDSSSSKSVPSHVESENSKFSKISSDKSESTSDDSSSSKSVPSNVESENSKFSKISSEKSESTSDNTLSSSRTQNDDLKEIVTSEMKKTPESVLTREECKKTVDEVKTASGDRVSSNDSFNLKVENSDASSEKNESEEHRNTKNIFGRLEEIAEHSESTSSSDNTDYRSSDDYFDEPSSERNVFTATHSRSAFQIKNASRPKTTSPSKKKFSKTSSTTLSSENIFGETEETLKISPGPSKRGRRRGKTALQTKCKGGASERERKASPRKRKLSLSPKKVPRKIRGRGRRTRSLPMICAPERAVLTETVAIVKEEGGVRAVTQINAQSRTTYTLEGANEPSVTSETVAVFKDDEVKDDPIYGLTKTQSESISHKNDNSEIINAGERKEIENDLQNSNITLGKTTGLIIVGAESSKQGDLIKDMGETENQETLFKMPNQPPFHISRTDTSSESTCNTSGLVTIEVFRRELRSGKHVVTDSFDLEPFDKALEKMEKNKSNQLSQETSTDSCQQNPSKSDEDSSEEDINKSISASGRVMKRYRIESSDEETRVMKNFERKKSKLCEDKQKETSSSPSDITNSILEEDLYLSESTCQTPETSPDESNKRSPSDDGKTRKNIKSSRADIKDIESSKKKLTYRKIYTSSESDEISGTESRQLKSTKSEKRFKEPTAVLLGKSPKSVSKSSESSETSPKESPVKSSEESYTTTPSSKSSGSEENSEECSEDYGKESKLPKKRNSTLKLNVKTLKSETSSKEIAKNSSHNSSSKESSVSQSSSENSKLNSSNESGRTLESETSSEESSEKSSEETCSSPKSSESQTSLTKRET